MSQSPGASQVQTRSWTCGYLEGWDNTTFEDAVFSWCKYVTGCIKLKCIAGVYHFVVNCAVKTALWLLKPGTLNPRLDPFQGFSSWYFWIPGQNTKIINNIFFNVKILLVV